MMTTSPSGAPRDYQKILDIEAAADIVFDAVTTTRGLSGWWTPTTGDGETGGELRFSFDPPEPLLVRVDETRRPDLVSWTIIACDFLPDWVGSRPVFALSSSGADRCRLDFRHVGLTDELECIEMCSEGWDFHLLSLRDYAETGVGSPNGTPAERARRALRTAT
jgi:uncharacterized protein YndB with AHSA1/START domain